MGKIKKMKKERAEERKKDRTKEIKREAFLSLQLLSRKDYLASIILSTLTLVVYAFTAAPGVTMGDSGDFIMGVLTLGIVHPPGYPLYTLLGHLFSLLPFGDPAFRVNLFSALWGSLCLGILFLILRMLSIERIHAIFATLFLGFTTVFWSKTGVAEVYSFNGFLIACIFFWILSYNRDKKKIQLYLIFLTTGLALSNHYPLVILSGVGLLFLLDRRDLKIGDYFKGLLFLGLGLTPYLYLFIQALNPEVQYNFGKLSDFVMVLDHILRKYYTNDYGGTVWDKFVLGSAFLKAAVTNFSFASLFLFAGITFSFSEKWKYRYPLLIAALLPSLGLILILTLPSDDKHSPLYFDYFIPAFLFLSVFVAVGLKKLMNRYVRKNIFQVSLLIILLLIEVGFNFRSSSHHNDKLVEIWGTELLKSLKPRSVLIFCHGSLFPTNHFSLYYLQLIKGLRQDVTLYDRSSWWTKDNLYGPELLFKRRDAIEYRKRREQQLINNSLHPIYYSCKNVLEEWNIKFTLTPFVYRSDGRHFEASDFTRFTVSDGLLDSLVNNNLQSDPRSVRAKIGIFGRLISYYGKYSLPELKRILDSAMKAKLSSDPQFILAIANELYILKKDELATKFYERAVELSLETVKPKELAILCNILTRAKNYDKALRICVRQEQVSAPCEVNTLLTQQAIAYIHKEQGNWPKVAEYSRKVLQCQPNHKIAQGYLKLATEKAMKF